MSGQNAVSAAASNPAAIDLNHAGYNYAHAGPVTKLRIFNQVIAAVEALRDQCGGLEIDLINQGYDNVELKDRAEAAEPHATELAGALGDLLKANDPGTGEQYCTPVLVEAGRRATVALNATPAEALERARAKDEVLRAARELIDPTRAWSSEGAPHKQLSQTLAKLDALDSVQRGIAAQEFFGEPEGMATHEQSDLDPQEVPTP